MAIGQQAMPPPKRLFEAGEGVGEVASPELTAGALGSFLGASTGNAVRAGGVIMLPVAGYG